MVSAVHDPPLAPAGHSAAATTAALVHTGAQGCLLRRLDGDRGITGPHHRALEQLQEIANAAIASYLCYSRDAVTADKARVGACEKNAVGLYYVARGCPEHRAWGARVGQEALDLFIRYYEDRGAPRARDAKRVIAERAIREVASDPRFSEPYKPTKCVPARCEELTAGSLPVAPATGGGHG